MLHAQHVTQAGVWSAERHQTTVWRPGRAPVCRRSRSSTVLAASVSQGSSSGGGSGGSKAVYEFQRQHHPVALAFLGDAVWSLYVRRAAFTPPKRHSRYLAATQPHVTAEGQAAYHDWLLSSGLLTGEERALLEWAGRRQDTRMRARFSRTATQSTYRRATALEALVGWLHLGDPGRLEELTGAALAGGAVAWDLDGGGTTTASEDSM